MPYYPDLTPVIRNFDPLGGTTRTNWHFSMRGLADENTVYFSLVPTKRSQIKPML